MQSILPLERRRRLKDGMQTNRHPAPWEHSVSLAVKMAQGVGHRICDFWSFEVTSSFASLYMPFDFTRFFRVGATSVEDLTSKESTERTN
jgi:hypothetical protein